jgi:ABC-type sugar transport system ATPase subunit
VGDSAASTPAVRLQAVAKDFASGGVHAVDHISFDVQEGELLVLLGPSGCGKTTTLRMIAGLEEPDAGDIWIGNRQSARPITLWLAGRTVRDYRG